MLWCLWSQNGRSLECSLKSIFFQRLRLESYLNSDDVKYYKMKIYYRIKNAINRRVKEWGDLKLIRESGFFDKNWYLAKNFDVAQSNMDPLLHYLRFGGFEG